MRGIQEDQMHIQPWATEEQYEKARWTHSHERPHSHGIWEGRARRSGVDSEATETHTGAPQEWRWWAGVKHRTGTGSSHIGQRGEKLELLVLIESNFLIPSFSLRDSDKSQLDSTTATMCSRNPETAWSRRPSGSLREDRVVSSVHICRGGLHLLEQFRPWPLLANEH